MSRRQRTGYSTPLFAAALATMIAGGASAQGTQNEAAFQSAPLTSRAVIEVRVAECSAAHPALAKELERQRSEWLARNADVLARLDEQVASLPEERRSAMAELLAKARAVAHDAFAATLHSEAGRRDCARTVSTFGGDAQSSYDANDYGNAAGIYHGMMVTTEVAAPECSREFPDLAASIAQAQQRWRQRDAKLIERAQAQMAVFRSENPAWFDQTVANNKKVARESVAVAVKSGTGRQFCTKFFDDLGSGNVRARTPKAFQFLENGPSAD